MQYKQVQCDMYIKLFPLPDNLYILENQLNNETHTQIQVTGQLRWGIASRKILDQALVQHPEI